MRRGGRARFHAVPLALAANVLGVGALFLPWTARAAYGRAAIAAWAYEVVAGGVLVLALSRVPRADTDRPGVAQLAERAFGAPLVLAVSTWYAVGITAGQAVVALAAAQFAAQAVGSVGSRAAVEVGAVCVLAAAGAVAAAGWHPPPWVTPAAFATVVAVVVAALVAALVAAPSAHRTSGVPAGYGIAAVGHAAFLQLFAVVGWESAARVGEPAARGLLRGLLAGVALVAVVYGAAVMTAAPGSVDARGPVSTALGLALPQIDGAIGRAVAGVAAALCTLFVVRNVGTAATLFRGLPAAAARSSGRALTRDPLRVSGSAAEATVAAGGAAAVGIVAAGWCRATDVLAVPDAMALAVFLTAAASAAALGGNRRRAYGVAAALAYVPLLPYAGPVMCLPLALLVLCAAASSKRHRKQLAVTRQ